MKKEELIKFIEEAFDGVEQPTGITLHVAEAHDDYDYDHDKEHRKKDYFAGLIGVRSCNATFKKPGFQDLPKKPKKDDQVAMQGLTHEGIIVIYILQLTDSQKGTARRMR